MGSIQLDEQFVINRSGRYTLLAIKSEAGGELVAKPVTFEFAAPAPAKQTKKHEAVPASPPKAGDAASQEWATLESKAGLAEQIMFSTPTSHPYTLGR